MSNWDSCSVQSVAGEVEVEGRLGDVCAFWFAVRLDSG